MNKIEQRNFNATCNFNDNLCSIMAVCIGVIGLFFVIEKSKSRNHNTANLQINTLQSFSTQAQLPIYDNNFKQYEVSHLLSKMELKTEKSIVEVGQKLNLTVLNYHKDIPIYISFGDGTTERLKEDSINHVYKKTGKFYVKMYFKNEGNVRVLVKEKVTVTHKIEIKDTFAQNYNSLFGQFKKVNLI